MSRICVATGSRADYGLLYGLLRRLQSSDHVLQLVVTGAHLSSSFGNTVDQIIADGFPVEARIEMLLSSDSDLAVSKSTGLGIIGFADALDRLKPDLLVVLGDRYEILAAAIAALFQGVPVAHIHGGEITEGAYDDAVRHSLTKMSHLHFVATETYRQRVIQMGESPDRVFNVGAPGIENIRTLNLLDRAEITAATGIKLLPKIFLVTYHPETMGSENPLADLKELLHALNLFTDISVILTSPGADHGSSALIPVLEEYARSRRDAHFVRSLGRLNYLSIMKHSQVVIGNSSSGIIEAPSLGVPTVNIGGRQRGRERAESVIDCARDRNSIAAAIHRSLSLEFREKLPGMKNPYDGGQTSSSIFEVLNRYNAEPFVPKRFYDLVFSKGTRTASESIDR
ncbi:MAG: UDP-N-acetylglucosamine 2-epimerase (hydrolyzing) [Spirochaetales bacterium]|nr:UDP-N-acetylglucosamine 2-epimerase (hydrolyzing) [Spirochaetales bacterium]